MRITEIFGMGVYSRDNGRGHGGHGRHQGGYHHGYRRCHYHGYSNCGCWNRY